MRGEFSSRGCYFIRTIPCKLRYEIRAKLYGAAVNNERHDCGMFAHHSEARKEIILRRGRHVENLDSLSAESCSHRRRILSFHAASVSLLQVLNDLRKDRRFSMFKQIGDVRPFAPCQFSKKPCVGLLILRLRRGLLMC